jgi:hypothetical protein
MVKPRIYADFQNADTRGHLRLNCIGTMEDLARQQIELREGLLLTLYSDDLDDKGQLDELMVDGIVSFSRDEHCWVAAIDWASIQHASDREGLPVNTNGPAFTSPTKDGGRTNRGT